MLSTGDAEQAARALVTARPEPALFADILAGLDEADLRAVAAAQADLTADLLEAMAGRYNMAAADVRAVMFGLLAHKRELVDDATRRRRPSNPLPPVVALLLQDSSTFVAGFMAAHELGSFADTMSALARVLMPTSIPWSSIERWGQRGG